MSKHKKHKKSGKNKKRAPVILSLLKKNQGSFNFNAAAARKDRQEEAKIAFLEAVEGNDLAKVKGVLEQHPKAVSWHVWQVYDELPLHLAVEKGYAQMANLLLDHGAKVNQRNSKRDTPLLCAVDNDQPEMVSLLLRRGADLRVRDIANWTVLDKAKQSADDGNPAVLEAIREYQDWKRQEKERKRKAVIEEDVKVFTQGTAKPLAVKPPLRFK